MTSTALLSARAEVSLTAATSTAAVPTELRDLARAAAVEFAASPEATERAARTILVLVALTGYGRGPDRQRALDAGFDEHLTKPVELDHLLARLNDLLARDAALAG